MSKVLIVDDEPDILQVLKMRVESAGHQVMTAVNGVKALEVLKTEKPNLIISDVLMPDMDGFQLYKELKQNPATAKIPVLILTARGKMEDTFRVIGVDDFISKPFETADFMAKIKRLLDQQSQGVPAAVPKASVSAKAAPAAKILLSGSDPVAVAKIGDLLSSAGYVSEVVTVGANIMSRSIALKPKLILLDILMDDIPADGIVQVLRRIPDLEKTPIVLYSFFGSETGEDVREKVISIDNSKELCMTAGATEYIGNFNERTFMKLISKFI